MPDTPDMLDISNTSISQYNSHARHPDILDISDISVSQYIRYGVRHPRHFIYIRHVRHVRHFRYFSYIGVSVCQIWSHDASDATIQLFYSHFNSLH